MSSTNTERDSEAADFLNELRKHIQSNKAGKTSEENFTPNYILGHANQIDISNAVTLNNNKHEFSNQIDISNNKLLREIHSEAYIIGADNNDQYLNGKRFISDGASQITIQDRGSLKPTAELTIAVRAYLIAFTGITRTLVLKTDGATYGYQITCRSGSNEIRVAWFNGSGQIAVEIASYTPNTWNTIVATFRSGNQDLYIDGSLGDSDTAVAVMAAGTNDLQYGGNNASIQRLQSGEMVEQLVIIDRYVDSTWATRYNNLQADMTNSGDQQAGMCNFMVVPS